MGLVRACHLGLYRILSGLTKSVDLPSRIQTPPPRVVPLGFGDSLLKGTKRNLKFKMESEGPHTSDLRLLVPKVHNTLNGFGTRLL